MSEHEYDESKRREIDRDVTTYCSTFSIGNPGQDSVEALLHDHMRLVNSHDTLKAKADLFDELVTALEKADSALAKYSQSKAFNNAEYWEVPKRNMAVLTKAKAIQERK